MHDNPNAALPEEVEPELTAIPPGNLVHRDNNLLPNHSNTRTGQVAEAEQAPVALPSREAADLLLRLEACRDRDRGKAGRGKNTMHQRQPTTIHTVRHDGDGTNGLRAKFSDHAQQTGEFHGLPNALPGARQKQEMTLAIRSRQLFR